MCVLGLSVSAFGAGHGNQVANPILPNGGQSVSDQVKPEDRYPILKGEVERIINSVVAEQVRCDADLLSKQKEISDKEAQLKSMPMIAFGETGSQKEALKKSIHDLKKEVAKLQLKSPKLKTRIGISQTIMAYAYLPVTNSDPNNKEVTDGHILSSYGCAIVKATTDRDCRIPGVNGHRGNIFQQMRQKMNSGNAQQPLATH